MKQGKTRWEKITLTALTAVLIGSLAGPFYAEAAGIRAGQGLNETAPTITENDGTTEAPEAGTVTDPVVKAAARVRVDGVDTEYTEIKEAWAAVNGREAELTLLDSVTTAAAMNTAFELTGGNVTLDLNGYKWTYQYTSEGENAPATVDLIELRGDASLTIKGGTGSAMVYAGSSNYKGACLYATGSSTLTIEGGTFSSNVSAPIYVDGATLNVKGGVFKAAGAKESAITMNNGTFNMTGGEVQVGTLTLNNTNGQQKVNIGGDSKLAGIVTKGKEALSIEDTLDAASKYQDAGSGKTPVVQTEEGQNGEAVDNVQATPSPIEVEITSSIDVSSGVQYSYKNDEICRLTAGTRLKDGTSLDESALTYKWSVSYDGSSEKEIQGETGKTLVVKNGQDAGDYTYFVSVTYTKTGDDGTTEEYTEPDNFSIKIEPLQDGKMELKADIDFPNTYTYGENVKVPEKNIDQYTVTPSLPDSLNTANLDWKRELLDEEGKSISTASNDAAFVENINAGNYKWRITVADEPNYKMVGEIPITVSPKPVYPKISGTTTKVYDGTTDIKGAEIVIRNSENGTEEGILDRDKGKVDIKWDSFSYDKKDAGPAVITAKNLRLEGERAGNYDLKKTEDSADGRIEQAVLKFDITLDRDTQSVDKTVKVTITARYKDGGSLSSDGPSADDIRLTVSGRNEPEEEHRLDVKAISGQNGVYTADYSTSIAGDKTFEVSMDETNNYGVEGGKASYSRLTIIKEEVKSALKLEADKSEIIYGDQVTYTATVTKVGGQAGDPIFGGVQFYVDAEDGSHKAGNSYSISRSGDTASITLHPSTLTVGEHTIIAVFTSDSAEGSRASVNTKVTEKPIEVTKTTVTIKASDSEITYGDDVTYTATVTKTDGKTGDALNGGVQFYMDEVDSKNRLGSAQTIKASGDQVKVKVGKSDLTAGDHKIIAVYTPGSTDTIEGNQAETTTKVEKKKLKWNTSGLRASKTAGTSGEVRVYGTLEVDGILDGEVKFEQPESMMTSGLKSADAGTYKVSVVLEDKEEWKFDPEDPKNYELPEGDPEIKASVNALKELSNPPEAKDGNTYKLLMEEGLSTVPDGLKNTSFNTPVKIEQELKRILTSSGVYTEANTKVYDVTLQVSTDEGKTWAEANADNFPSGGVLVTLPYPGGTGRHTHNFAVAHMFGESLFGHTSGTVEVPNVTKTDNGLQFRVTGLSPIAVSWTDGAGGRVSGTSSSSSSSSSSGGSSARRLLGAQTGDDSPILLYVGLAVGCTLLLVILLVVVLRRRNKKIR